MSVRMWRAFFGWAFLINYALLLDVGGYFDMMSIQA